MLIFVVFGLTDTSTEKNHIATLEHPIYTHHKSEWTDARALLLCYARVFTCSWKKEAGPRSDTREVHLSPEKDLELEGVLKKQKKKNKKWKKNHLPLSSSLSSLPLSSSVPSIQDCLK